MCREVRLKKLFREPEQITYPMERVKELVAARRASLRGSNRPLELPAGRRSVTIPLIETAWISARAGRRS